MGKNSAARIELGRSFHQMGTVNEKVNKSEVMNLGKVVQCQRANINALNLV